MRMMGLRNTIYWFSWFLVGLSFNVLSTLILIFSGMIAQFEFFLNSNFAAVFLLFFLFSMAMTMVAFFLSSILNSSRLAQTVGYSVILIGFVFQSILCSAYGGFFLFLFLF
jgi:hypothetical protein